MTKRESKKLDRAVDTAFKVHGNCVQFSIMDLGKISRETREAVIAGGNINDAMEAAVTRYRKN